jgi:hypothetical protein
VPIPQEEPGFLRASLTSPLKHEVIAPKHGDPGGDARRECLVVAIVQAERPVVVQFRGGPRTLSRHGGLSEDAIPLLMGLLSLASAMHISFGKEKCIVWFR